MSLKSLIKFLFLIAIVLGSCFFCNVFFKKFTQKTPVGKRIFAFIGAPGAGKGTLAGQCVSQLGFKVLSTGDLCRAEIASGSEKGKMIKEYSSKGLIVPDKVIIEMVQAWLDKQKDNKPIILDGCPRTEKQASMLHDVMKNKFPDSRFRVTFLQVFDEEEVVKRLTSRLVCKNKKCQAVYNTETLAGEKICKKCGGELIQRADDKEDVIRVRLATFKKNNAPIISFYNKTGVIVETFNASNITPKQMFENFKKIAA